MRTKPTLQFSQIKKLSQNSEGAFYAVNFLGCEAVLKLGQSQI
ncbi:hypothetical protein PPEP_a2531 [Pseudoalteromonas peptidolytica F12-50-A1]|uniref:Uncharacterized protein n=1 Tax=Pseudoalteromonas peptidolytica F12-50-A1 TaxID=1315280 RepID=A0A8I0T439_9GAMM|nr:hypothetical protein [Pseudoalteromonas peptidolytica F12-50-A1]